MPFDIADQYEYENSRLFTIDGCEVVVDIASETFDHVVYVSYDAESIYGGMDVYFTESGMLSMGNGFNKHVYEQVRYDDFISWIATRDDFDREFIDRIKVAYDTSSYENADGDEMDEYAELSWQ